MTTGRNPAEAVSNYRHSVQRVVSCVTTSVVDVAGGYYPSPVPHRLTMNNGFPVALDGPSRFRLELQQYYRIVETGRPDASWMVDIVGFYYTIYDSGQREVLLYHWHPHGNSPVETPHLHLEQGAEVGRAEVRDAHLPTGDVSLNAILRVLIEEMGVRPRRSDWESILAE